MILNELALWLRNSDHVVWHDAECFLMKYWVGLLPRVNTIIPWNRDVRGCKVTICARVAVLQLVCRGFGFARLLLASYLDAAVFVGIYPHRVMHGRRSVNFT